MPWTCETWFITKTRDVLTGLPISRLNSAAGEDCAEGLPRQVTTNSDWDIAAFSKFCRAALKQSVIIGLSEI